MVSGRTGIKPKMFSPVPLTCALCVQCEERLFGRNALNFAFQQRFAEEVGRPFWAVVLPVSFNHAVE